MASILLSSQPCTSVHRPNSRRSTTSAKLSCGRTYGAAHSQLSGQALGTSVFRGAQLVSCNRPVQRQSCAAFRVEANLFSRIARVFRSYANAIVSSAEDPEKMLEQTVNEMQGDLIKMRQASAQVVASKKQLEAKYNQAKTTSDDWYRRAELALQKGEEELAREALKRRKVYEENAQSMKAQLDAQAKATDTLIANTRMLEQKLAEAKSKKDTLKARAKSAAASKQISDMVQGLNTSTAMAAFDKMEEKVLALEAESEATLQLAAPDELDKQFAKLEGDSVDSELAKLKTDMLAGKRPKAELPEGRPIRDAIDWELEELRRKARD